MEQKPGFVRVDELEAFLNEIETLINAESYKADYRAKDSRASEFYCSDMKGYSRGVSTWGLKTINLIRDKFCRK